MLETTPEWIHGFITRVYSENLETAKKLSLALARAFPEGKAVYISGGLAIAETGLINRSADKMNVVIPSINEESKNGKKCFVVEGNILLSSQYSSLANDTDFSMNVLKENEPILNKIDELTKHQGLNVFFYDSVKGGRGRNHLFYSKVIIHATQKEEGVFSLLITKNHRGFSTGKRFTLSVNPDGTINCNPTNYT